MAGCLPCHVRGGLNVGVLGKLSEQRCFSRSIFQSEIHNEHRQQIGFASIKAALENMQLVDVFGINGKCSRSQLSQCSFRVRRWNAIFVCFGRRIGCAAYLNRQRGQGQFQF